MYISIPWYIWVGFGFYKTNTEGLREYKDHTVCIQPVFRPCPEFLSALAPTLKKFLKIFLLSQIVPITMFTFLEACLKYIFSNSVFISFLFQLFIVTKFMLPGLMITMGFHLQLQHLSVYFIVLGSVSQKKKNFVQF